MTTHVIVVCDTFDHKDYPVLVTRDQGVEEVVKSYNGSNMQRVVEVYALHLDWDLQLGEMRSYHTERTPVKKE